MISHLKQNELYFSDLEFSLLIKLFHQAAIEFKGLKKTELTSDLGLEKQTYNYEVIEEAIIKLNSLHGIYKDPKNNIAYYGRFVDAGSSIIRGVFSTTIRRGYILYEMDKERKLILSLPGNVTRLEGFLLKRKVENLRKKSFKVSLATLIEERLIDPDLVSKNKTRTLRFFCETVNELSNKQSLEVHFLKRNVTGDIYISDDEFVQMPKSRFRELKIIVSWGS